MAKALHPGRAAQNGYAAALLAQAASRQASMDWKVHEALRRCRPPSTTCRRSPRGWARIFDLRANTYKPFPCGIVNHPTIDGCIQIHDEYGPTPDQITAVRLRVAPLVMDLCNQQGITKGLQGKFSVYHGAAIGLVRGKAGIREYTDEAVNDPQIKRVRELVSAVGDPSITEDQARIEVELASGVKFNRFVEQSLGNIHRPMTDKQLEAKFRGPGRCCAAGCAGGKGDRGVLGDRRADGSERINSSMRLTIALALSLLTACGGRNKREVRIPKGAGGVGFLPLLVMEKYHPYREVCRRYGPLDGPGRSGGDERCAAVLVGRFHLGGPAGVSHLVGQKLAVRRTWEGVAAMTSMPMYL